MVRQPDRNFDNGFRFGDFDVAPKAGLVKSPDGDNRLEPRVMHVFVELAMQANEVSERRDLLAAVWPNQVVLDENLSRAISVLRKVLGAAAIETIPKVGYRLVGPVRVTSAEALADERTGIAVLPFLDPSPQRDNEYFADGLAEELLNLMTKIPVLRVSARTSSFAFRGTSQDVPTIAARLNVDYVLEGSVRKFGDRLRITTQLIDAASGNHLWSENYDVTLGDVFSVQDEVASAVVRELNLRLVDSAVPTVERIDPEAYNLVLLGRHQMEARNKKSLGKALDYFQQALAIEPEYAMAWAGLAKTYTLRADIGLSALRQSYEDAREAAERALELDPALPEAAESLGWIFWSQFEWERAEKVLRRALQDAPSNVRLLNTLANVMLTLGRSDEAFDLWGKAISSNPLHGPAYTNMGLGLYYFDRLDEALQAFMKQLDIAPETVCTHFCISRVYLLQNQPKAALAELELEPDAGWRIAGKALAFHALGEVEKSDAMLENLLSLRRERGSLCCEIAFVYAYRGQADEAFYWLDQAYDSREGNLCDAKFEPMYSNLHPDPRWRALLGKLNLAD